MTKIMLVEDDKSLREIYGVRLLAEGYDIVSAGDGEEALAMAIKERPQLIVSDVMMPKISGFDMLDILRSTTETRDIKVIMMTALSSEEQRVRGESLGADRYLVKSQVGIEDVVRVVHEVLGDGGSPATPEAATPQPATPQPVGRPATPAAPAPAPTVASQPPATPSVSVPPRMQTAPAPSTPPPAPTPTPTAPPSITIPAAPQPPAPAPTSPPAMPTPLPQPPKPASIKTRVIQPLNDPSMQGPDINELLDRELAKEAGLEPDAIPTVRTAEQEKAALEQELASFRPEVPAPADPIAEEVAAITAQEAATAQAGAQPPVNGEITIDDSGTIAAPPPPPPPPGTPTA